MGLKKLENKRIEYGSRRHVTYSKRKYGIVKKAYELSVLSDVDVAFISFSSANRLSFFSGNKRIEDVFARYINSPDSERKYNPDERQNILRILNKIRKQRGSSSRQDADVSGNSSVMAIWQEAVRKQEELKTANANLKIYECEDVESITSVTEIEAHENFLVDTLEHVLGKIALYGNHKRFDGPLDQTQANIVPLMPPSASLEVDQMLSENVNLNMRRSSLKSIYQQGQAADHHGHTQLASSSTLPPSLAESLSPSPPKSKQVVLTNPTDELLRAARKGKGLMLEMAKDSSSSSESDT